LRFLLPEGTGNQWIRNPPTPGMIPGVERRQGAERLAPLFLKGEGLYIFRKR